MTVIGEVKHRYGRRRAQLVMNFRIFSVGTGSGNQIAMRTHFVLLLGPACNRGMARVQMSFLFGESCSFELCWELISKLMQEQLQLQLQGCMPAQPNFLVH